MTLEDGATPGPRLRLNFRNGHHAGQRLEFTGPRTLILGRGSNTDVQIQDERISRRHCALRFEGGRLRIRDLGSGNGTLLNGRRVEEAEARSGAVLTLGHTEIGLQLVSAVVPPTYVSRDSPPTETHRSLAASAGAERPQSVAEALGRSAGGVAPGAPCAFCGQPIAARLLPFAVVHRGRVLCPRCAPRAEVPGYRFERLLGEGGMGKVYLAEDLRRGRPVALKILKLRGSFDAEDKLRFEREASTAASLDHPNIVRVLEFGEAPPFVYCVMEFVRGRSLKEWIEHHGPLPLTVVLRVAHQVAQALQHAAARHVVHRDVKPENILVTDEGHAKLADFGLAKSTLTAGSSQLTRPGDGLGTLPYMPPEQIDEALFADHRSDIYSFGATVYHMLTGVPPFVARSHVDYFQLIRAATPTSIEAFRPDVPRVIVRTVEKCLAKDPADRYQDIGDVLLVLDQFLSAEFDQRKTAT